MSDSQLWQQCSNLSHHSLEAFLLSLIQRPNIYNLYQFLKHPNITSVDKKVFDIFRLFVYNNYNSLSEQLKTQLSKQKLLKMKKITILSLFEGLKEISLGEISKQISSPEEETVGILIQMSITGIIDVKIDERKDLVEIHYAQIRARSFNHNQTKTLQSKISTILNKNKRILGVIDETYSQIRNKKQSTYKPMPYRIGQMSGDD